MAREEQPEVRKGQGLGTHNIPQMENVMLRHVLCC
jgi:hypothetical protein